MTNETQKQIERERTLLETDIVAEALRRGQPFLEQWKTPEEVAHKLAGDILITRKNDYLEALPHYEAFGEVPDEVVRDNQILYLGLINDTKYAEKFQGLIKRYGTRFSDEDVRRKFIQKLQDVHSCFLTGPANVRTCKSLVKLIEDETGVKFERKLVREAYLDALKSGFGLPVEHIFSNSNCERFKPKTQGEYDLVGNFIRQNVTANSLATPRYVQNIPIITGVSPSYQLLLNVGREKAKEVVEGKLHPDYMREYIGAVESLGHSVLGKHLYGLAHIKRNKQNPMDAQSDSQKTNKQSFVRKAIKYFSKD